MDPATQEALDAAQPNRPEQPEREPAPGDARKARNEEILKRLFDDPKTSKTLSDLISDGRRNYKSIEELRSLFLRAALRQPDIWDCTIQSILQALIMVVDLDVSVSGHHNGAYFEVRKTKIKSGNSENWVPCLFVRFGYGTLIELALRDGSVTSIDTNVIRSSDEYEYQLGTDQFLRHVPRVKAPLGEEIAFYAIARFANGQTKIEITPVDIVRGIHQDLAANSPAWKKHFAEMGRKIPLKRMLKTMLVTSPRFASVLDREEQFEIVGTTDAAPANALPEGGGLNGVMFAGADAGRDPEPVPNQTPEPVAANHGPAPVIDEDDIPF